MTTPTSGMPSQTEVDQLLLAYGIMPDTPAAMPGPIDLSDPAVLACAAQRQKAEKDDKPVTQVIATTKAMITPVQDEFVITPGNRLAQLFDEYDQLKEQLDALKPRVDDLKDAIKAALHELDPHARRVQLFRAGRSDGLVFAGTPKTYMDGDKLKADYPDAYAACSYEKDQWELRRIGSRGQHS
jgi:hypothetical protein